MSELIFRDDAFDVPGSSLDREAIAARLNQLIAAGHPVAPRSKSSRPRPSDTWPPVTAPGTTAHKRCRQVCMRIRRWRRSQSISAVTSVPGAGSAAPGDGTWITSSGPSPFTASTIAIVSPEASRKRPVSPGWPPPVG